LRYGSTGAAFAAPKLEVLAVSSGWQGRRFACGARIPPRNTRVFAVVHEENAPSIALCSRHGLEHELTRPHPRYRGLVTRHL